MVPDHVDLIYRQVGSTHVFISQGLKGLVHVGSYDRRKAFSAVIAALSVHVEEAYGEKATYEPCMSFEEFERHADAADDLKGNFLTANLLAA